MPVIVSLVATGYIWQIILGPNIGMLNPLTGADSGNPICSETGWPTTF